MALMHVDTIAIVHMSKVSGACKTFLMVIYLLYSLSYNLSTPLSKMVPESWMGKLNVGVLFRDPYSIDLFSTLWPVLAFCVPFMRI